MNKSLQNLGPAIIVAAVVCGPGSILSASKTGANYGYSMTWVIVLAVLLMIGSSALSARLGAIMKGTPCDEITESFGRFTAILVGSTVFLIAAGFQTSNNMAVFKAIAPYSDNHHSTFIRNHLPTLALIALNSFLLFIVYRSRSLYKPVETLMKVLIGLMVIAFIFNFIISKPSLIESIKGLKPSLPENKNSLAVFALIATTFSIAGAFYQAYLVRDRGWNSKNVKETFVDTVVGITTLGLITLVIMLTAASTLSGKTIKLETVNDMAIQMENLFGNWAGVIFTIGIFAGALSSFLINAMIGGRLLADGFGKGGKIDSKWSKHCTAFTLLAGLFGAFFAITDPASKNNINPIIIAQASTILGGPTLALALLFLGIKNNQRTQSQPRIPTWMLCTVTIGFIVTLVLAFKTYEKLFG
ncbi:MAG TPA: divalent metal cation transporter [Verrucomicrobia bacterium]|nr:divalent metal cation transporter [Verrucomicrobiales bacterium]HIL54536.1 divalent metal cation transporter [Verrucomicrobiota bacterium]